MPEAILISNLDSGSVSLVGATDTLVQAVNVKPTTYDNIRYDATVQITTTGTSALNPITIKLKMTPIGGTPVTVATWQYKPLAEVRITNQTLSYIGNVIQGANMTAGGSFGIFVNASTTDAQTTFIVLNQYVTGVE